METISRLCASFLVPRLTATVVAMLFVDTDNECFVPLFMSAWSWVLTLATFQVEWSLEWWVSLLLPNVTLAITPLTLWGLLIDSISYWLCWSIDPRKQ